LKGVLVFVRGNYYRRLQLERKHRFRGNHGWFSGTGHHTDNSGGCSNSSADYGAYPAAYDPANQGSNSGRRSNHGGIPSMRGGAGRCLIQLRVKRQFLAVDQRQFRQIKP
jgi:hypothetical protein